MAVPGPRVAVACSASAAALVLFISLCLLRRRRSSRAAHSESSEVTEASSEPFPTEYEAEEQEETNEEIVPSMALEVSTERHRAEDEAPSPDGNSVDSALCESPACSSAAVSPRSVEEEADRRDGNGVTEHMMAALILDDVDDGVEADAATPTKLGASAAEEVRSVVEERQARDGSVGTSPVSHGKDVEVLREDECEKEIKVQCESRDSVVTEHRVATDYDGGGGGGDAALGLQSAFSDVHSEGSSDSGKGGSDIHVGSDGATVVADDLPTVYEFELPQDLCGRLIGRGGRNVTAIKDHSNANVYVRRHPFNSKLKLCAVEGTRSEVKVAMDMIRKKFPLSTFPNVTLAHVNTLPYMEVTLPETLQLHLPEGVTCDVVLTSMVTAGHFFLQQPTHPTYPSLARLDQCMLACYSQVNTPPLPRPVEAGIICAAEVMGGWFRALVVAVSQDGEECDVKFVDYGGYLHLSTSFLRQIRSDFMTLPFQASECYLGNVQPVEGSTWSVEACAMFEDLAQGQILQSLIVGYADNGLPYVHLYRIQGVSNVFINRELVNRGVARWTELAH